MYALFHPGDLALSDWLWLLLFWGGIFTGLFYLLVLVIKRLKKR